MKKNGYEASSIIDFENPIKQALEKESTLCAWQRFKRLLNPNSGLTKEEQEARITAKKAKKEAKAAEKKAAKETKNTDTTDTENK